AEEDAPRAVIDEVEPLGHVVGLLADLIELQRHLAFDFPLQGEAVLEVEQVGPRGAKVDGQGQGRSQEEKSQKPAAPRGTDCDSHEARSLFPWTGTKSPERRPRTGQRSL